MIKRTAVYCAKLVLSLEPKLIPMPQTTKLNGRPIQKFDAKTVRLIYTICSKNLRFFLKMTGNFCKETKYICKKFLRFWFKKC